MKKNIVTEIDTNAFTLFAKKKKRKKMSSVLRLRLELTQLAVFHR